MYSSFFWLKINLTLHQFTAKNILHTFTNLILISVFLDKVKKIKTNVTTLSTQKESQAHMLCAHTVPLLLMKGADKKRNKNHFFAMGDRVTFFGQACTVDQEEEKRVAAHYLLHTHYIIVPSLVIGTMYIPTYYKVGFWW